MHNTTPNTPANSATMNTATMMNADSKREMKITRRLERYAAKYSIFMDTSSFLNGSYERFMDRMSPLLRKYDNAINVPVLVIEELRNLARKTPGLRCRAEKSLAQIETYISHGLVRLTDEGTEAPVADDLFVSLFTRARTRNNLLLITNDVALAQSVKKLRSFDRDSGICKVMAKKTGPEGALHTIGKPAGTHLAAPTECQSDDPAPSLITRLMMWLKSLFS